MKIFVVQPNLETIWTLEGWDMRGFPSARHHDSNNTFYTRVILNVYLHLNVFAHEVLGSINALLACNVRTTDLKLHIFSNLHISNFLPNICDHNL